MTGSVDLRFGRWQDVLADVECDALIVDAPYSERTHAGHDGGTAVNQKKGHERRDGSVEPATPRRALNYKPWTPDDVRGFVASWANRTRGWIVSLTDHVLAPVWEDALKASGRCTFSPLAFMAPGSRVRMCGDGPSQWSVFIVVARPTALAKWGALPGGYVLPRGYSDPKGSAAIGGKPLWIMQSLVRDYSKPGDLVCDPCAGSGSTLLAASIEGRRAVGAECMQEHFDLAQKRLSKGFTPTLDFGAP